VVESGEAPGFSRGSSHRRDSEKSGALAPSGEVRLGRSRSAAHRRDPFRGRLARRRRLGQTPAPFHALGFVGVAQPVQSRNGRASRAPRRRRPIVNRAARTGLHRLEEALVRLIALLPPTIQIRSASARLAPAAIRLASCAVRLTSPGNSAAAVRPSSSGPWLELGRRFVAERSSGPAEQLGVRARNDHERAQRGRRIGPQNESDGIGQWNRHENRSYIRFSALESPIMPTQAAFNCLFSPIKLRIRCPMARQSGRNGDRALELLTPVSRKRLGRSITMKRV
jgi:hypothetical protein